MGKTYLSGEELLQFSTIKILEYLCEEHDPEKWGLCQRDNEVVFGEADEHWTLQVSLSEIHETAHQMYGSEYNPDRVMVFYAIEVGNNNMEWSLYELSPNNSIIQMMPLINGVMYE